MTHFDDLCVAALYRFTPFDDCTAIAAGLSVTCQAQRVKGTLLLAGEGINGTIAGSDAGIAAVLAHIRSLPGCRDIEVKSARAAVMPFHRMKVRIKREIVTMGEPWVDPLAAGRLVAAANWNALIDDPDTIVIDTRNAYEVAVGSFAGAIDPGTRSFSEFPDWFRANRQALLAGKTAPRVAMFCTGGIRCEKATAFLKAEGVGEVFHLDGGILRYLENVAPEDSRWQGECFVFDERVAVAAAMAPGTHVLCRGCRMPVSASERQSPHYIVGVGCPHCHGRRDDRQRSGYAERQRQAGIAAARGSTHVGG